jgi:UDP-2,3-diacylglucosamine pyrophosphatase LpxH
MQFFCMPRAAVILYMSGNYDTIVNQQFEKRFSAQINKKSKISASEQVYEFICEGLKKIHS